MNVKNDMTSLSNLRVLPPPPVKGSDGGRTAMPPLLPDPVLEQRQDHHVREYTREGRPAAATAARRSRTSSSSSSSSEEQDLANMLPVNIYGYAEEIPKDSTKLKDKLPQKPGKDKPGKENAKDKRKDPTVKDIAQEKRAAKEKLMKEKMMKEKLVKEAALREKVARQQEKAAARQQEKAAAREQEEPQRDPPVREPCKEGKNSPGRSNLLQKLFGSEATPASSTYSPSLDLSSVHSRQLLTPSVYHNPTSDLWIATIHTNPQKLLEAVSSGSDGGHNAPKYLKAFSFPTEKEARASAYANAPPKMDAFSDFAECRLCQSKFSNILRRPRHCRNCGICICSSCCVSWSNKMIPETYNYKNESAVKACKSCDWLAREMKKALLAGNYALAVELYQTGNVNLRCPFAFPGEEIMFPVHCAIEGQSENLLRWLVDVQFCPIHLISTGTKNQSNNNSTSSHHDVIANLNTTMNAHPHLPSSTNNSPTMNNNGNNNNNTHDFVPTLKTSKNRSILSIAMTNHHVGILSYLINEKQVSVYELKDLNMCLSVLEYLISLTPNQSKPNNKLSTSSLPKSTNARQNCTNILTSHANPTTTMTSLYSPNDAAGILSDNDDDDDHLLFLDNDETSLATTVADPCILCQEKTIDCVITPCGHQICCLSCSQNLMQCPMCDCDCNFIKIYRP